MKKEKIETDKSAKLRKNAEDKIYTETLLNSKKNKEKINNVNTLIHECLTSKESGQVRLKY